MFVEALLVVLSRNEKVRNLACVRIVVFFGYNFLQLNVDKWGEFLATITQKVQKYISKVAP
jgi:hypothetical protein